MKVNLVRVFKYAHEGVRVIALKARQKLVSVARVVTEDNSQTQLPLEKSD